MLLEIGTTHRPATDLGYLLHKNPTRCQSFEMSFGRAHVFYPEATDARCTAALLLDVDPVGMVRGGARFREGLLDQYVNDRPYVASSFMSVAIAQIFGSAMGGRCKERPELADSAIPLTAKLSVLPCRGGERFLERIFGPLGYEIQATRSPLDEQFPEWGESPYFTVTLTKSTTLHELLTQLYVLIPVFDHQKHYFVGEDEQEKLLTRGAGWLSTHPERETIAYRFLKHAPSLARQALAQLEQEEQPLAADADASPGADNPALTAAETSLEERISLNEKRIGAVLAALRATGARRVLDLGCGEGTLIRELLKDKQFEQITGLDVSIRALELASSRLRLDQLPLHQKSRVALLHGSLMYRDRRLNDFDAATVVEVIEHLDPPRRAAFERVLFECARPASIVLTTVNREYNALFENLPAGKLRHPDHRFEWTRSEFRSWAEAVAVRFDYVVRFLPVGPEDSALGPPTQMAIFTRNSTAGMA
jgi:3' terminal RNA ribose 2'-O-methyltransferase Hen1